MTINDINLQENITIILPTYNEASNRDFWLLLDNILHETNCKIIVVDDGTDNLEYILINEYKSKADRIKYLRGKNGESESIELALLNTETYYSVIMDSDGSHPFTFIKQFIEILEFKYDKNIIVIGSRYFDKGSTKATIFNKWISKISNKFAKLFLGLQIDDLTGRLLAGPTKEFLAYDIWYGHGDAGIHFLNNTSNKTAELGIIYTPRTSGQGSTDSIKGIIKYLFHYFIRLLFIKLEFSLPFSPRLIRRSKSSWSTEKYNITYTDILISLSLGIPHYVIKNILRLPGFNILITNLPSNSIGYFIRHAYYATRFGYLGKNVLIDKHCTFINQNNLYVYANAIIDENITIIAPEQEIGIISYEATIHRGTYINGRSRFHLGMASCIGHYCILFSDTNIPGGSFSYATRPHNQVIKKGQLILEDNVYIGANSLIINSRIESAKIVGAQSFIKDDEIINGVIIKNVIKKT